MNWPSAAWTATVSPLAGEPSTAAIAPENTHGCLNRSDLSRPACSVTRCTVGISDQPVLTPNRWPTAKVTAAASPPSSSMRMPDDSAPRPVNSDSVAPTANSASAVSNPVIVSA